MATLYQVVFTGELTGIAMPEQVARDFASVFKVPEDKAWKLVASKDERVVKKEVDYDNAERYRNLLEEIGLKVRIEPVGGVVDAGVGAAQPIRPAGASVPPPLPVGSSDGRDAATGAGSDNPYAPPAADLASPRAASGSAMTGPLNRPAGHGWLWIKRAYALVKEQPGAWMGAVFVVNMLNILAQLIPFIGYVISAVIGAIFLGGLMYGADQQHGGQRFRSGHAFEGFSRNAGTLAAIGGLYLLGMILVFALVGGVAVGIGLLGAGGLEGLSEDPEQLMALMGPGVLLLALLILAAIFPLVMAYWFAPALAVLEGITAIEAMKFSFRGCWMNIVPFLVYGLAFMGLTFLFAIVVGIFAGILGAISEVLMVIVFLLLIPLMLFTGAVVVASMYVGYRDIFYGD